jgi:sugar/nucleoside kinase (ribokinase family)
MFAKGIAVIGSTTIDTNVYADKCFHKIGGVTTYSGITYRRHGITTHIISNVAQKDIRILDHFKHEQLIIHNGFTKQTTQFVNRFETDKRSQEISFYASSIAADQITDIGDIVSAVHLGPLHSTDIDSRCMKILSESGLPVFIDVQGYTRHIRDGHIRPGVSKYLSSVLKICRIAKANESELESILRYFKMDLGKLLTTYGVEEFIVTQGRNGGYVRDYRGCEYPYDAVKIQTVQDPTGAGDVFLAAYMVSRFLDKLNIEDACGYAAKLSAHQISGRYIAQDVIGLSNKM